MRKSTKKATRVISFGLCLLMMLGLVPLHAFASGVTVEVYAAANIDEDGNVTYETAPFAKEVKADETDIDNYLNGLTPDDTEVTFEGITWVFSEWEKDSSDVSGNIKAYAKYVKKTYPLIVRGATGVTQNGDGIAYNDGEKTADVEDVEAARATLTDPTHDIIGKQKLWRFSEWDISFVNNRFVATPVYEEIDSHVVTLNANGGNCMFTELVVEDGKTAEKPADPSKEGYVFVEWRLAGNAYDFNTPVTADIELTAEWAKLHTVTFVATNPDDATKPVANVPAAMEVTSGAHQIPTTIPTTEDYTFDGWICGDNTHPAGSTISVSGDMTLTAKWRANAVPYTVKFNANNGTGTMADQARTVNDGAALRENTFTRTGYTFANWNTQADGKGATYANKAVSNLSTTKNAVVTLYAIWTPNQYKLTLNPNGGKIDITEKTITFGEAYGHLPLPTRTGYTFAGWARYVGGSIVGDMVSSNTVVDTAAAHELIALWNANSYKVTFDANGGTGLKVSSKQVIFGQTYGTLETPVRNGYTFVSWKNQEDGKRISNSSAVETAKDHKLVALWMDPSGKIIDGTLAQTGQLNWPIALLGVFGALFMAGGAVIVYNSRKGKYEV